jgi:hypothetical protein
MQNMGIDLSKTSHIFFFIILLPTVSVGVGWVFAELFPNVPFWMETISPLAAYGILYSLFERHAWHLSLFRTLGVVTIPDVRGRWLGEQTSSYKDENGKHRKARVIMEIEQTFSSIKVETYYRNWRTEHCLASFINVGGECTLFIMFETTPKVDYDGDATAHKGVVRLIQLPDRRLSGTYFNAMGRHGELMFKRTRYTLHKTFDSVGGS